MGRLLAESETRYTDFRVEDCDGLPKAVFDRLPAEQGSLLSWYLYPNWEYAGARYVELMSVSEGGAARASYEDDLFAATITPRGVVIETKGAYEKKGARVRVKFSLREANLLLLKWKFECMRWGYYKL